MKCPLPVEWLDAIERGQEHELESHLAECSSCRTLIESLREAPSFKIDPTDWKIDEEALASAPHWAARVATEVNYGQIWLTRSDFDHTSVSYSDVERVFVVVLDKPSEEYGWSWVPVAPLLTDTDNVTTTDLILRSTDSTLNVPFGAYFRYQTLLAIQQLETCLGELTAEGRKVFDDVMAGKFDDARFGTSLEAADDLRLVRTEFLRDVIDQLGAVYAEMTALHAEGVGDEASTIAMRETMEALSELADVAHESVSNVILLSRWNPLSHVVLDKLAAASSHISDERFSSYFRSGHGASEVRAVLNWDSNDLLFWFERLEDELRGAQVFVCLMTGSGEKIVSPPFEATPETRVSLPKEWAVLPSEVEDIELAVTSSD